jgi:diguanylate cyclase (GGDEF)-like protein
MAFSYALNSISGSVLLLILIFIDYYRRYNTNARQRGIYLKVLAVEIAAMAAEFVYLCLRGSGIDIVLASRINLVWPAAAAVMLFVYFSIIRADLRTDALTGLGNRYRFVEYINRVSRRKPGRTYALALIDIASFKEINNTLGRAEGDNALRDAAALIKGCVGKADFAARYGGDEFVCVAKTEPGADMTAFEKRGAFEKRLDEAAALHNRNAGRPYTIELDTVFDEYRTGTGTTADEFLARVDGLINSGKNKHRRSSDQ